VNQSRKVHAVDAFNSMISLGFRGVPRPPRLFDRREVATAAARHSTG
jgi:hypothetical protein